MQVMTMALMLWLVVVVLVVIEILTRPMINIANKNDLIVRKKKEEKKNIM